MSYTFQIAMGTHDDEFVTVSVTDELRHVHFICKTFEDMPKEHSLHPNV